MLKHYYSLREAAEFLSSEQKAPVSQRDVLDLAMRGTLRLCFWHTGMIARFYDRGFLDYSLVEDEERQSICMMRGYILIPQESINPESNFFSFDGVEAVEIVAGSDPRGFPENCLDDELIGALGVTDDQLKYATHKSFRIPTDSALVPATDLLNISDHRLSKISISKGAETRRRETLFTIIAAIADQAGLDLRERGAAARIAEWTEHLGAPVGDDTIRGILKQIQDVLEERIKK